MSDGKIATYIMIALLCLAILIGSWLIRPSQKHYGENCTKDAYITALNEALPDTQINTDEETQSAKPNKSQLDYAIECSDLHAQWSTSDATFVSYAAGLVGIVLLGVTIFETLGAGRILAKQNEIALMSSELELQPYLTTSKMKIDVGQVLVVHDNRLTFSGSYKVFNKGKIPANLVKVEVVGTLHFDGNGFSAPIKQTFEYHPIYHVTAQHSPYISCSFETEFPKFQKNSLRPLENITSIVSDDIYGDLMIRIEFEDAFSEKNMSAKVFFMRFCGKLIEQEVTLESGELIKGRFLTPIAVDSKVERKSKQQA